MQLPASISVANARLPVSYKQAKTVLAECARIDECQNWENKPRAMASNARLADDDRLVRYATPIQARAVRRVGELLNLEGPSKGGRSSKNPGDRCPSLDGWVPGGEQTEPSLEGWIPKSRTEAASAARCWTRSSTGSRPSPTRSRSSRGH